MKFGVLLLEILGTWSLSWQGWVQRLSEDEVWSFAFGDSEDMVVILAGLGAAVSLKMESGVLGVWSFAFGDSEDMVVILAGLGAAASLKDAFCF
ncbi:hypothetical protein HDV63DRAFT_47778 [Trichoderma sp. SZMC 28014]